MKRDELHTTVLIANGNESTHHIDLRDLVIAGWTGRDKAAIETHIRELENVGVKRPRETPLFYRISASLITISDSVQVVGTGSSGEAEVVLLNVTGELWIGLGSDHTDRELETAGVTIAKQLCPKPIAPQAWKLQEARDHWDQLRLRSYATRDGRRRLYQDGLLAAINRASY